MTINDWKHQYTIPTVIGIVASGIWWVMSQSWQLALASAVAISLIAVLLTRVAPFVTRVQGLDQSEIGAIYKDQAAAAAEIQAHAATAQSLDILTIRGLGIIGLNDSLLRQQLFGNQPRRHIRVLLLAPDGAESRSRAAEVGESHEAFAHGIHLAIQRMRELAALNFHNVEVYLYDRQPCWRIISLDDVIYVSYFGANVEGHRAMMYRLDPNRASTFHEGFRRMFSEMCSASTRVI